MTALNLSMVPKKAGRDWMVTSVILLRLLLLLVRQLQLLLQCK